MITRKYKALLGGVAAAAVALSISGAAQAGSFSYSFLETTNVVVLDSPGGTQLDSSDFSAVFGLNSGSTSATLNGVNDNASVGPQIADADTPISCVGTSCGAGLLSENTFGRVIPSGSLGAFAESDQQQFGSIITGLGNPVENGNSSAEAQLQLPGSGSGQADTTSTLTSGFVFTLASATAVTFEFDAAGELYAELAPDSQVGSLAQADFNFVIRIAEAQSGALVFEWSPDGNELNNNISCAAGVGAVCGTENSDDFDMQQALSTIFPGTTAQTGALAGFFSATTNVLAAGVQYNLTIQTNNGVEGVQIVPEPGTIGLLGMGLLVLGGILYRRRDNAAL